MAGIPLPEVSYCQLNISQCIAKENNNRFVFNVHNSLARNFDEYVRVLVISSEYQVLDPAGWLQLISCFSLARRSLTLLFIAGRAVQAQLVPISSFVVQSLPRRESRQADSVLAFLGAQLPPLGSKFYDVERIIKRSQTSSVKSIAKLKAGRRGGRADSLLVKSLFS